MPDEPDISAPPDSADSAQPPANGDARPPTRPWVRVVVGLWLLVSQVATISLAFSLALFNGFLVLLVESIRPPGEELTEFSSDFLSMGVGAMVLAVSTALIAWLLFAYRHHTLAALVSGLPLLAYAIFALLN